MPPAQKQPPSYWTLLVSIGSLILGILAFLNTTNKADAADSKVLEQRLCRLEALNNMGECKR